MSAAPVLAGRRALVTGATRGIGRAIALALAESGAAVAVAGRDEAAAAAVVAEIEAAAGVATRVHGDVSDEAEVARMVEAAARDLGGLDVLVNNAGIDATEWRPVHEWSVEAWDGIFAVNLRGAFLMSRAAIPHMLEAGAGAILHISSVCAITVWAGDCAYDASKAALNMLSDHIAVEYGPQRIRSNTLMPACVRTELHEYVMDSMEDDREFERQLQARHPIGRFSTPEEIAQAAVPLCATAPGFMTGANIPIDGAYSRI